MEIYLDNAATTKPCQEAVSAAMECMTENYGNPSSLHKKGLQAQLAVDDARKAIAKAISADSSCIYFTSGATESNNIAVVGSAEIYGKRKPKIVTTSIEHASVKNSMAYLEENGFEIVRIAPDKNGQISPEAIVNATDERTCLVSIMMVNNETGYILPVKRAFYGIKKRFPDCITHCDAVQGFMKLPFKVTELCADMVSMSGHKIHGGKGVGALYIKKEVRTAPRIFGGGQEKGVRSGTESVPMIAAMGAAVKKMSVDIKLRYDKVSELNASLRRRLSETEGVVINSDEECSPYVLNISVPGIRSEIMLHYLEEYGIYVSSGSACSKGAKSGVLSEFGLNDRLTDSALRISLCAENTAEELNILAETIESAQKRIIKTK